MSVQPNRDKSKPRDARLLHLLLTNLSVQEYEENVLLQLLTFAHNYVYSSLSDAQTFADHRLASAPASTIASGNGSGIELGDIKLAISSKLNHSFKGIPPKEFLLELAGERNRRALPSVGPGFGLRLPPEKYCLTAPNWSLDDDDIPMGDAEEHGR